MNELDKFCEEIDLDLTTKEIEWLGWNKSLFNVEVSILLTLLLLLVWIAVSNESFVMPI